MKKFFLIFALVLQCLLASAQNKNVYFPAVELTVDNESGVYAKGDTVKVYGRLAGSCEEPLEMCTLRNGNRGEYVPVSLSSELKLIFKGVYDTPESVMVFVNPVSNRKTYSGVGFMVAPEEFRPGYELPSDFVSYWDRQKKSLRKSRAKVVREEVESPDPAFKCFRIEISMPEGNPVRGYMAMPAAAEKHSLPIVLFVHSAGVNRPGAYSTVKNAVKYAGYGNGAIALDINAHGCLPGMPQEYYDRLNEGELKKYSVRPLTSRNEFYFRLMFLRELRAMDYLCKLPEWDGKKALVYGESQGGMQGAALCGLDPRITAAVLNVPAGVDLGGSLQGRRSGWPSSYGKVAGTELGRDILPYFDGALFLQHTSAKLFVTVGMVDETCHPCCVYAGFNASSSPDKVIYPFAHRAHSHTAGRFGKIWKDTVGQARTEWMNEYLKN